MKHYEKATPELNALLQRALEQFHPDLVACEVRVGAVFVYPEVDEHGEIKSAPIKLAGARVAAQIRRTSVRDRILGVPYDAIIEIDADRWHVWPEEQCLALLDHELEHLEVVRDKEGGVKSEDDGRPKLSMKPDDYIISGFACVARRHGKNAVEVAGVKTVFDMCGQGLFPWAAEKSEAA